LRGGCGGGVGEAGGDLGGAFGAALFEAAFEFIEGWGHDEDVGEGGGDEGVVAGADHGGAFCVDVDECVDAAVQAVEDLGFEGAVGVAVDVG